LVKDQNRITRRKDELHDLAEESTNGAFASVPDETEEERKKNHGLVDDFIKNIDANSPLKGGFSSLFPRYFPNTPF
jgi:hypothetical protein